MEQNEHAIYVKPTMKNPIYNKSQPETICKMFGSIAKQYDRTNAILSLQLHKHWNLTLVRKMLGSMDGLSPETLLDLCCGTGEVAFTFLKQLQNPCSLLLLDFCKEMLECAKEKAECLHPHNHHFTYIQADAQQLPLESNTVDGVTIAYGIRNVQDPRLSIQEVFRVLRPNGVFGILELTRPENPFLRMGHSLYLHTLLPLLGWCVSSNQSAYHYLCRSIHHFINPQQLEQILKEENFCPIERCPLHGGIATILIAKKIP